MTDNAFLHCTKCKREKLATDFSLDQRKLSGRSSWCRECTKEACQEYEERRRKARWAAKGLSAPAKRQKPSDVEFARIVAASKSIREVMVKVGLNPNGGGTYKLTKDKIEEMELDTSHMLPPHVKDLADMKFGHRRALDFVGLNERGDALWRCRCEAGFCGGSIGVFPATWLINHKADICRTCSYVKDLRGNRYGKLLVTKFLRIDPDRGALWECQCDCGNIHEAYGGPLEYGVVQSCGCMHYKGGPTPKHGYARKAKSPEYTCLQRIIRRCINSKDKKYSDYGGRGITVSDRWYTPEEGPKIENFVADVGKRPHPDWSIDRIDADGNYEPGNVRWAPSIVQDMNKRKYRAHHGLLDSAVNLEIAHILTESTLSPEAKGELRQKLLTGYYQQDAIRMVQAEKYLDAA